MYTFIYCMMHDDGCIITGNHAYVPEGYKMQHATTCESCDWYNVGVIDANFEVVERLRLNYDRFGGGFTFGHYEDTLTDEMGNPMENKGLDNWLRELTNEAEHNEAEHNETFLEKTTLTVKPILINDLTGEEEPFGDETGTPQFYMVKHTLEKYLNDEDIYIYTDDADPEWLFTIAQRRASAIGVREKIRNYKAIIKQIYEVNTLAPLWPDRCPSSHIKFAILN
jgi:hypothetical protein